MENIFEVFWLLLSVGVFVVMADKHHNPGKFNILERLAMGILWPLLFGAILIILISKR